MKSNLERVLKSEFLVCMAEDHTLEAQSRTATWYVDDGGQNCSVGNCGPIFVAFRRHSAITAGS